MNYSTWKERSNRKPIIRETIDCIVNPGIIIGKGGKTIQGIQNTTNTRIKIFRDKRTILITAYEQKYIDAAKDEIEKISCQNYEENYEGNYDNREKMNEKMNEIYDNSEKMNEINHDFLSSENFPALGKQSDKNIDLGVWEKIPKN